MQTLSIDIETYSSNDLKTGGVYKYVEASDFEILLFAYAFEDEVVQIVDLAQGEELPKKVMAALLSPKVEKKAFNANFERVCISRYLGFTLPPSEWSCTMVQASMLGLPLHLEAVAKALKLEEEKMSAGKALIRYFSIPCKPTKTNGQRTRNLPIHDIDKWKEFKRYCIQDVVVEREIRNRIAAFPISADEKELWNIDQQINDRGVLLKKQFAKNAISIDAEYRTGLTEEAILLTGLDNPNSAAQLKDWLSKETGETVNSLTKDAIPALLKDSQSETVTRILNIRQEMAKTSVKKYQAMINAICKDSRVRGLLQFYGANRTGRWAGRLVQVQNLPRIKEWMGNKISDTETNIDLARGFVLDNDTEIMQMIFGNVPDILSQLIRTAFVAPEGSRLIVSDFSAIEARVIAWLAGEQWRLQVFKGHGKIYEASAAQMFKVPIESITKTSPLRQRGKVAELALGYQGGPDALIKMGALEMGLEESELPKLVKMWRNANKAIVQFWYDVDKAAVEAIETGATVTIQYGIKFFVDKGILFIQLPSGRRLAYYRVGLMPGKFGQIITYWGMNQTTKQWMRIDTYGGKLVENIVQAVARDCLAYAIVQLEKMGYPIVMHVHDEVVIEMKDGKGSLKEVDTVMSTPAPWAKGLPLKAESYETLYYKKD